MSRKRKKRSVIVIDLENKQEELTGKRFIINEAGRIVCGKVPRPGDVTVMLNKSGAMEIGVTRRPGQIFHNKRLFTAWLTMSQKRVISLLSR